MDKRRSEKPDTEIRALPQAPDVTVAEWLRRWIVAPTTRVQFSPVTPDQRRRSLVTLSGDKVGRAASLLVKGVRLVESRQSLKLASGVRFAHPPATGRWRNWRRAAL